jgi:hypothetical protein
MNQPVALAEEVHEGEEDYAMDVWAGVLPLNLATGKPIDDARLNGPSTVPEYVKNYKRA